MAITKKSLLLSVCPCMITSGIILLITSVSTSSWLLIRYMNHMGETQAGLFQVCFMGNCVVYDDHSLIKVTADLKVIRGLCITALIVYGFGLVVTMYMGLKHKKIVSRKPAFVCLVLCLIAAVLNIAGVGHYVRIQEDHEVSPDFSYRYGYSLHMAWASSIPVLLAGIISCPVVKYILNCREVEDAEAQTPPPPSYAEVFNTQQNGGIAHISMPAPEYNSLYAMTNPEMTANLDDQCPPGLMEKQKPEDFVNPGV